jgi:GH24 family phage-related lysozyme (muramidase)/peptidoglycan hydrolase-like protein with peptidoglycan-binding domain
MALTIGANGLALIKKWEGCDLKAVKLVGEKYYTIGYGHTFDPSIKKGTVWTKAQAEAALKKDLKEFENYVNKYVPIPLNQNQFDALVSYTYNRGLGGLKQLIANSKTISDYSKNIVVYWGSVTYYKTGLVNRRKAEQKLFNTPYYPCMGSTGDEVRLIQKRLKLCGWNLEVDGIWGKITDSVVKAYQLKVGLTVDGIAGPKTQAKLVQDAIISRAKELADYLVRKKWHYKGGDYKAKSTFEATKNLDNPGCTCAHFVSWVLQDVGLIQNGKILSHTKAGYGIGKKSIVNADKLIGCKILYPNKPIGSCDLQPGDVIVHDSSIGIYAPLNGKPCVVSGRDGQTVNSKQQYTNLYILSGGYEWRHNVLAVVRASITAGATTTPAASTATTVAKKETHDMDTLRKGDEGQQVRALQKILGGLDVDGEFGPLTQAAVEAYQRQYKLEIDGIVGPKTWGVLLGE